MKNRLGLILTVLVLCFASVCALSACNIESEGKWEITADTKADCLTVLNGFFEETLKDPNVVVTIKNGDEIMVTENVKGTDSCYVTDDTATYCYKKGNFYYLAVDGQSEVDGEMTIIRYYYTTDSASAHYDENAKTYYDQSYCFFKGFIKLYTNSLPDDGTFTASNVIKEKNNESSATLNFDYSHSKGTLKITATAENDLVKTVSIVISSTEYPENNRTFTMTFVYGNAVVDLPDTDAWDREETEEEARIAGNEQALNDKADFFAETTGAENVVVTASINGNVNYIDAIMNDMERTEFFYDGGNYTVYTFIKETDEGYADYYYVFDSEDAKYYLVNDDVYDDVVLFYYYNGICLYDSAAENGATLSCTIEDDTLTFTISAEGETKATLVATKVGDTVSAATYTITDEGLTVVMTYSFEYGTADIVEPDLTGFDNSSSEGYDEDDGDIEDDEDEIIEG